MSAIAIPTDGLVRLRADPQKIRVAVRRRNDGTWIASVERRPDCLVLAWSSSYNPETARLYQYVEQFFAEHAKTEWPTVRRITKAFRWSQARLQDAIDGEPDGRLFTSSYFVTPEEPFGQHFVESLE